MAISDHQPKGTAKGTATLTINAPNGDKIVAHGTALDMMTLDKIVKAAAPAPDPADTVQLVGVKDGIETVIGTATMSPKMKAQDLVREMFGAWEHDDGSDADLAFAVCEQLIKWMPQHPPVFNVQAPAVTQQVPAGMVLAPIEPTSEMVRCAELWDDGFAGAWGRAIAALLADDARQLAAQVGISHVPVQGKQP